MSTVAIRIPISLLLEIVGREATTMSADSSPYAARTDAECKALLEEHFNTTSEQSAQEKYYIYFVAVLASANFKHISGTIIRPIMMFS